MLASVIKSEKPMKIVNINGENFLRHLTDFNEIFRKDVTYDNIKSHKKSGLQPLGRR